MRVFYENLITAVENSYNDKSTLENVLYLEDIIKNTTTDIYVQYKKKTNRNINYNLSSIDIGGIIKIRNHLYFINNNRSTYNNYITFETTKDNIIKIVIRNPHITNVNPYVVEIYLNETLIETISYEDEYSANNQKVIQLDSTTLGTILNIT